MRVSVIIPTLDEETAILPTLEAVRSLGPHEIILADGGSIDRTTEIARPHCKIVHTAKGRGTQQSAGAQASTGDIFWFLHADSTAHAGALEAIIAALRDPRVAGGNFTLHFDGEAQSARQLTTIYPFLRLLGLCYGDSGIFVRRDVYEAIGGFRPYPLFEDVDLVRRIGKLGKFVTVPQKLTTSSRRFEHRNFGVMFAEWTTLQLLYWAGVSPHRLARMYAPIRRRSMPHTTHKT